ncbi:MAG: hypothetical protein COW02_12810 [Comamonadaceae bacterium CG12_big_fil_rev_8_21_14_0_65_59_15]|uniref:Uncharacterized protein n=1 Tax=bacterium (Candidatus Blackallbacteria) CG17_big_fil_post_rev_8_21_14_2_50_48_46 TaxID=2014261 RepID=A0A2M7G245_9BACT|nr:MAG: hypothetical protein COW64_16350 [bacterium (Candidatus Blackallbacteria) CG18_big_fil_WC_8_21_14_2_50_49_26]PIQ51815.1 MAG: hypothetical protein COW02_12810 [Comamonadaceae bacterium CG12_big_fil_rev_8_21_14_0_65_59_15]PIW15851.1 MAG: hypothetical protein COW36_15380 [bacterium (Candidatus Blackallbacteria) CG17_big_fil_post_rev_8_21_14_2_50_48_46]PIW49420.1 MAG: hypothetical protein COW20_05870 [bacterium (Candidatus Blackallbacteria) CG13_big_fil_rev_8_21_14_2_50_49_14]
MRGAALLSLITLLGLTLGAPAQAVPLAPYRLQELPVQAQSIQKKAIPVYRFGSGEKEIIFLFAAFHGDESQGPYMLEQLMGELIRQPGYYAEKTIYCIPMVNPDGFERKSRTNGRKVDLNRNFPTHDYRPGLNAGTRYYAGPQALSEPESRLVYELIKPHLKQKSRKSIKILSIHGPLAVVNYDGPAQALAQSMARYNQLPVKGEIGYATPGSFGTYYGKELGIPVITLETGSESPESAWKKHRNALLALLQYPNAELVPTPKASPTALPSPVATPSPSAEPSPSASPAPSTAPSAIPPSSQPSSLSQTLPPNPGQEKIAPLPEDLTLSTQELKKSQAKKRRLWLLGPTPSPEPTPLPTPIAPSSEPTPLPTPVPTPVATPVPTPTPYQPGQLKLPAKLSNKAYLRVSKRLQTLQVIENGQVLLSVPVSTGLGPKDTPEGSFSIISKVPNPPYYGSPHLGRRSYPPKHPHNPLGTRWMQLNVGHFKTRVAIGLHGTDEPNLIGKAISGGCVRMHNGDVEQLFKILRVGMKVVISAK